MRPADPIRIDPRTVGAALFQRIGGGETRVTRADHGDLPFKIPRERRAGADRRLAMRQGAPARANQTRAFGLASAQASAAQAARRASASTASASAPSVANLKVGVVTASGAGVAPKPFAP